MAGDTVNTQLYENGFRNVVLGITILSDGTGVTNLKIFDAASATYGVNIAGNVLLPGVHTKLVGLDFDVQDQKFQLAWDATTPVPFLRFGASPEDFNWRKMGGLYAPQDAIGLTGSILLTTINPMPDASLTMILYIRKDIKQ